MIRPATCKTARSGTRTGGRLRNLVARFRDDRDGATAVEFALVSVPFLGLLFAIFETAFVFFATQGLEAAVSDAARGIMTGQVQGNTAITTAQQFRDQMICAPTGKPRILPGFVDCTKLLVDVRPASTSTTTSFGSANVSRDFYTASTQTYCTGGPNDVVVVRVVYPMPVYLSIVSTARIVASGTNTAGLTSYQGGLVHIVMGTAAFRNEPFPDYAGPVTGC
jgi:Flp pilus assembly protein TadG